jgi:hypothetical protein
VASIIGAIWIEFSSSMISNEIFAQDLSGCRLLHRQDHSGGRLGFPESFT